MSLPDAKPRRRNSSLERPFTAPSKLPVRLRRRTSSLERRDPYSTPDVYYGDDDAAANQMQGWRGRAISSAINPGIHKQYSSLNGNLPSRRLSHDEHTGLPERFPINVESTLKSLREREDTDNDYQITIDDNGPKVISLGTLASAGYRRVDVVRGNYMISNLLQELTLAQDYRKKIIVLDLARLNENPVDRLSRRIRGEFWHNLTRSIDGDSIEKAGKDPKDWTADPRPRIYIPSGCPEQHAYYTKVAQDRPEIRLDVVWLPEGQATPEQVRDMNDKPGLLALDMIRTTDREGQDTLKGVPFLVPGGRFNELYGWDSYMGSLGLLEHGRVDLAKAMVQNFCFCIKHYGKILNGNRSYYLCRSQPPFLTDMTDKVFTRIAHEPGAKEFLRLATLAAIKEYYNVWMAEPRYDPGTGLSRYHPGGVGVPPETEASHFQTVIKPYAKRHSLTFQEFVKAYNAGNVKEPELDEYFLHDRAVRESGHDTSYRLESVAAHLATVDLNSLLYKYESDIARTIKRHFSDRLPIPDEFLTNENRIDKVESSAIWDRRAKRRKALMDKYMWSEEQGMYFDFNTVLRRREEYRSATTFWTMWAKVATPRQAAAMILKALPQFEEFGGLASGTEKSRGPVGLSRPNRQWDYPFGWAPQQMLAWEGFLNYGYLDEAQRLAYKWLYMVTKAFVDFNGVVVEKYNVTRELDPHKVSAEYGNQGADFKGVPREGFGWVNASYAVGLSIVSVHMRRALGTLTKWDTFAKATEIRFDDDGSSETGLSPVGIAAQAIPEEGSSEIDGVPMGHASEALVEDGETATD